jgi:hypothetical protein
METKKIIGIAMLGISVGLLVYIYKGILKPRPEKIVYDAPKSPNFYKDNEKMSPKEVLEDMSKSAEITSKYFHGDINLLKQQTIQAHRLGTTLEDVAEIAGKLVDFEQGIESELKAATFVGGQFNLSRARALAFEGKIVEAQEETLNHISERELDTFKDKLLFRTSFSFDNFIVNFVYIVVRHIVSNMHVQIFKWNGDTMLRVNMR